MHHATAVARAYPRQYHLWRTAENETDKVAIGSTFDHRFLGANGTRWIETYQIQPDRTVEIVNRRREVEIEFFNHDR